MTTITSEVFDYPAGDLIPDMHRPSVERHALLSSLNLKSWTGNMTLFDGFYNTSPVAEYQDVDWDTYCQSLAGDQPTVVQDKCRARYFVPTLLRDAPLSGSTRAKAQRLGRSLFGKQRSRDHVIDARVIVTELDQIDEQELRRIQNILRAKGLTYLIFSTHSYGKQDKRGIRIRIVVPIDRALNAEDYARAVAGFNVLVLDGKADTTSFKLCQQQGVWATAPDRVSLAFKHEHLAGTASASYLIAAGPPAGANKNSIKPSIAPVIFNRERVRAALAWLSPENYDEWITVGLWLKAAYGDSAFPIWADWSANASDQAKQRNDCSTYSPEKKWSDFHPCIPASAGAGKLFATAKSHAIDTVREGYVLGELADQAKKGLVYLRLYHPNTYQELIGGGV